MKIQKFVTVLFAAVLLPFFGHSQLKTIFSAPDEILQKCNRFKELPYRQMIEVETYISKSLYLYFENSVVDTLVLIDSVSVVDENCLEKRTTVSRNKISLKSGRIYIVKNDGSLLNTSSFEDVMFPSYDQKLMDCEDPICGLMSFCGFGSSNLTYFGFKTDSTHLAFDKSETLNEFPLLLKFNGKWGMMDFDGNIIADFVFDKIEYDIDLKTFKLFKNNLLAKIIKKESNK